MSDLERDLRNALAQRASTAAPEVGDWQDLTMRMRRRDKRTQRLLATGLVLAVLAGPVAGFSVANAIEDDGTNANRITAAGPGDGISTSEGLTWSDAASTLSRITPGGTLDPLFRRTTDDGITVRGFRIGNETACGEDSWCPPPECIPNASISGQLSTDAAVGLAFGSTYPDDSTLRVTGWGGFGDQGEGSPSRWVIAQTADDVAQVRFEYDGASDEMAPEDGVVILAVPGKASDEGGTVVALDSSGAELERADVDESDAGGAIAALGVGGAETFRQVDGTGVVVSGPSTVTTLAPNGGLSVAPADPSSDGACAPQPPALPEPGEQPGDADAARQAIESAFVTAYNGGLGDTPEKRAVVEGSESLVGVMDQIRNGSFAQQVKDATAKVTEIVFVSPTEAAVRYDILVANYSNFTDRIGRAKLIDGVWKVAHATVCKDISLASGNCPG